MSKEGKRGGGEKKTEKDYRSIIRARAAQSKGLRQPFFEKVEKPTKSLRQKVELAKEKKET